MERLVPDRTNIPEAKIALRLIEAATAGAAFLSVVVVVRLNRVERRVPETKEAPEEGGGRTE